VTSRGLTRDYGGTGLFDVSELGGIGLIVVVVIAAGAFTFDAHHGLATFLRTRVASMWQLVLPRFAVNAAAAAIAYLLGTLAAWYETDLLIGSFPAARVLAGPCAAPPTWRSPSP
jgi:ABC-2 type transport system permease protein